MPVPPPDAFAALWRLAGLPPGAMPETVLDGADPVQPSTYALGTAALASIGACGAAAAAIHRARGGPAQRVAVGIAHALIEFHSERHLRVNGEPVHEGWDRIAGLHRCGDGRWVRLHTNLPHHREGMLRLLGCDYDRDAVGRALQSWQAEALETAAAEAGLVATMTRSLAEWEAHPQGEAAASLPALTIERIGDAPPTPLPPLAARPLAGIRVLDLTRVIAGPVAGRTLAAHGAEVLHISGAHLPSIPALVMDTGRGKRCAALDLRREEDRARLRGLAAGADIFLQGYRPGAIAGRGFGPEALAAIRPGIVCVSLSAYGHRGPWSGRRGFDSLVQNANGMNEAEREAAGEERPRPLPCQALDHASGYLLAFGAMAALLRRAEEGGSWLVRVSLASTGEWIKRLGRVEGGLAAPGIGEAEIAAAMEDGPSGFGPMRAVRHSAILSATPAHWSLPAVPLGTHPACW
ncbi:crotonobetainyl-CoA:carnitine CoA-transferase CaiB-like acyl-CoA transferase [Roseomonas alkaliterrae]|uniref:Crotonobetainyl-CoA:carnitine CoA-transferase CaiB-like acyl-CoA transferase n=2 Tax=Neoroseomonas alkaliterrae TaxID=1452450 RepID=A0A840XMF1_9PROT|nr:CoA transferase [Neoroseomonas alkaliterrae]MBB5689096.1 crotonobetainyl-CoA:carnitine CoA-transferase CaiB-like acyl-CoA transferase [Neoroseomonas alkaliterrae]